MLFEVKDMVSSRNVPCWGNQKKYIAVHYLGVVGQSHDIGADGCGAHFYIYWDGTIYQRCSLDAVPWAVGTGGCYKQKHPQARNANTISIEMCCKCDGNAASAEDKKWYFTEETQEACAWLVAKLMREQGIPLGNVLRHYDIVNKTCPAPYVHNNKYRTSWTWEEFKARTREYYCGMDKPEIRPGMTVKLTRRVPLRSGVSTKAKKAGYVKYASLKSDVARKKCRRTVKGNAAMKKGRKVVIREVRNDWKGNVWVRIKIGGAWIPVVVGGKYRVTGA